MSTRAIIALKTSKGYAGVYNHFDGYPTGLGKELWKAVQLKIQNSKTTKIGIVNFITENITGHKAGWSSFGVSCYCHDGNETVSEFITEKTASPLHHEFVYIFDPVKLEMKILAGRKKSYDIESEYEYYVLDTIDLTNKEMPDWEYIQRVEASRQGSA